MNTPNKIPFFLNTCLLFTCCLAFSSFTADVSTAKTVFHPAVSNGVIYVSPIPAIGVGPNGLPTKKINVNPYCCPSDAIEVTGRGPVGENDFQWVLIPLTLPQGVIKGVKVCYSTKGKAFIAQTRLSVMTTPDKATVELDDATHQGSVAPTCYVTRANVTVNGTITLELKVVIPEGGSVVIGGIELDME